MSSRDGGGSGGTSTCVGNVASEGCSVACHTVVSHGTRTGGIGGRDGVGIHVDSGERVAIVACAYIGSSRASSCETPAAGAAGVAGGG